MNLYCIKECPIGKVKSKELLNECESSIDAAFEMRDFVENCKCPYSEELKDYQENNC